MTTIHASILYDDDGNTYVITDDPASDSLHTDWERLEAMSDVELRRNAEGDPDASPLTQKQRSQLQLASSIHALRQDLGLEQEAFAARFGFDLAELKSWERGRRAPDATTEILLRLIAQQPELVARVVQEARLQKADAAD